MLLDLNDRSLNQPKFNAQLGTAGKGRLSGPNSAPQKRKAVCQKKSRPTKVMKVEAEVVVSSDESDEDDVDESDDDDDDKDEKEEELEGDDVFARDEDDVIEEELEGTDEEIVEDILDGVLDKVTAFIGDGGHEDILTYSLDNSSSKPFRKLANDVQMRSLSQEELLLSSPVIISRATSSQFRLVCTPPSNGFSPCTFCAVLLHPHCKVRVKMKEGSSDPKKIIVDANQGGVFVNPCPKCLKLRFQLEELERLKVVAERDGMRVALRQLYPPDTPVFSTRYKTSIPARKVEGEETVDAIPSVSPSNQKDNATEPGLIETTEDIGDSRQPAVEVTTENSAPPTSLPSDMPKEPPVNGSESSPKFPAATPSCHLVSSPSTKDLSLELIGMDDQRVLVRVNGELIRFEHDTVTTHENGSVELKRFKNLSVNLVRCASH